MSRESSYWIYLGSFFCALILAEGLILLWPSDWATSAVVPLTEFLLVASILLALYRQRIKRAFWTGFAVCLSIYFVLYAHLGMFSFPLAQSLVEETARRLEAKIPGRVVEQFHIRTRQASRTDEQGRATTFDIDETITERYQVPYQRSHRTLVGHCLFSIILGLLGGSLAILIFIKGERHTAIPASPSSTG